MSKMQTVYNNFMCSEVF